MNVQLDSLLNLPNITVETCSNLEDPICLQLQVLTSGIHCPHCGSYTEELHQNRPILVRDLPTFGKAVYLQVPRRQFYCSACQRYVTEILDFIDWKRRHTQRYEAAIYQRIQTSSIEQVSREEGLSVEEVKGIFDHVNEQRKKRLAGDKTSKH
jgi:transposase